MGRTRLPTDLVQVFRESGAVAPERAIAMPEYVPPPYRPDGYDPISLMAAGVIREAGPGRYYLDEVALKPVVRRSRLFGIALLVGMFVWIVYLFSYANF